MQNFLTFKADININREGSDQYILYTIIYNIILVEEVREVVQLNWPDAETGVDPEDQDRSCSVLTNYMDNGRL